MDLRAAVAIRGLGRAVSETSVFEKGEMTTIEPRRRRSFAFPVDPTDEEYAYDGTRR
jgi:hypothetical protein